MRTLLVPVLGAVVVFSSGCGLISKAFEGKARFAFSIDSKDPTYNNVVEFNPNSDDDVRNNRDKLKSGQIKTIVLQVSDIQATNGAKYIGGQIDVKRSTDANSAYITAAGRWDGVPLYHEDGVTPALGQEINLDLPPDTINKLRDLVFNLPKDNGSTDCAPCKAMKDSNGVSTSSSCPADCLDFRINGLGYSYGLDGGQYVQKPTGPVQLSGDVVVELRVVAGG